MLPALLKKYFLAIIVAAGVIPFLVITTISYFHVQNALLTAEGEFCSHLASELNKFMEHDSSLSLVKSQFRKFDNSHFSAAIYFRDGNLLIANEMFESVSIPKDIKSIQFLRSLISRKLQYEVVAKHKVSVGASMVGDELIIGIWSDPAVLSDKMSDYIAPLLKNAIPVIVIFWMGLGIFGYFVTKSAFRNTYPSTVETINIADHLPQKEDLKDQLRESEIRLLKILDLLPDIISIIDRDGNLLYNSPAAERIHGYKVSDMIGRSTVEYVHPEDRMVLGQAMYQAVASPGTVISAQYRYLNSDKTYTWMEAVGVDLSDNPAIGGILAISRDIDDRKKLEFELIDAKKTAEDINKMKSAFFSTVSHELKTPLMGILGFADLLFNNLEDSKLKHYAENIVNSASRLDKTTKLILNLVKLEAHKVEPSINDTDIVPLLEYNYQIFIRNAEQKHLQILFSPSHDLIIVPADERLFVEAVSNLISNAVKYTDSGSITISTEILNGKVLCRIKDTGIGISKDDLPLVFEEFRQVSEGFNRSFEGTGLGLTISKRYLDLMGFELNIESQVGKGTEFTIVMPLIRSGKLIRDIVSTHSEKAGGIPRILLVENDPINQEVTKSYIEEYVDLSVVSNGEEAIATCRMHQYDLILMDINLGKGIDGVQTANVIRLLTGFTDIPVIAITAFGSERDKEFLLNNGMNDYIAKPFTQEILLDSMSNLLRIKLKKL